MSNETWKYCCQETGILSNGIELAPDKHLTSIEKDVIEYYCCVFGSKEFLSYHAQCIPFFALRNGYISEEASFTDYIRKVHVT